MTVGSVKEASSDIHAAVSREQAAGSNQTRNDADQYWEKMLEDGENVLKIILKSHFYIKANVLNSNIKTI